VQKWRAARAAPKGHRVSDVTDEPQSSRFHLVGIGASAGGLEAFTQLLEKLPADSGMAFVLVPHLDPAHASLMAPILSKATSMPVAEVMDGVVIEPNHVYVIPPNTTMAISGGTLRLAPGHAAGCINHFLTSLAREWKDRAVGVILSGTATDGTLGLEAIKSEGGITFAQDPESARHPGMPRSATSAGCVDHVLRPEEIARELVALRRVAPPAVPHETLRSIFQVLQAATGVDFSLYKPATVQRRIARRMALQRRRDLDDYLAHLRQTPSEVHALHHEILIHVTSFFREPDTFEALRGRVFPRLIQKRDGNEPIRVWVPGCSTGEEAYSLAIALSEFLEAAKSRIPLQIFATDISELAIDKARAGCYPAEIAQHVSEPRLRSFFAPQERGGYQISKAIRDLCIFARQDLLSDPPFSRVDLLSCRNVLIYLEPAQQRRILQVFGYALVPGGFLVLGPSEAVDSESSLFSVEDRPHRIYSKSASSPLFGGFVEPARKAAVGTVEPRPAGFPETAADVQREADRLVLNRFAPAGVLVNEAGEIVQFRGDTAGYLQQATGRPSFDVRTMARGGLLAALESALAEAREKGVPTRRENLHVDGGDGGVNLEVQPVKAPGMTRHFLVLFRSITEPAPPLSPDAQTERLRQELAATKDFLQANVERLQALNDQLRAANEEIMSSNEELQSTNEELETAKEELQSTNEELTTLNDEMQHRNAELGRLNDDLHNLMEGVNIAMVMVDRDLRIRRFTPQAGRLFNLIGSDLNRPIGNITPTVEVSDLSTLIRDVMETLRERELDVRDANGHWYSLRVRPYRTRDDRIDGAMLALVDVDVLKRAMQSAEEARASADSIVESVRDPLVVLDGALRVRRANSAYCERFRTRREEAEGNPLPWDVAELRTLLEGVLREQRTFQDFEVSLDFPRVGRRDMRLHARPVRLEPGEAPLILLAMEDVTDRRFLEEASQRLGTSLDLGETLAKVARLALPHMADGCVVHIVDGEGGVRRVASAHVDPEKVPILDEIERRFPAPPASGRGESNEEPVNDEHRALLARLGSTSRIGVPLTVRGSMIGGLSLRSSRAFTATDLELARELARRAAFALDNARLYGELQRAVRGREEFLSVASHELKTPVATLLVLLQHLEAARRGGMPALPPERVDAMLDSALRQSERLASLINTLLDVTRITGGRLRVERARMDLRAAVSNVVERFAEVARARGISIGIECDEPVIGAWDRLRMEQVVTNLLSNAIKYGEGKPVTVSIEPSPSKVTLTVRDEGVGIREEAQRRLFQPFERVASAPPGGLGLGLYIVRQIVEAHDGTVSLQSDPGAGTTVRIELPIALP
jgi:two-component system CheB/CheR fusion protein